ncbi:hypothetical protein JOE33_001944 [Pseudomonas sp. PvP027]|uniref:hypothetical protein n=1 Tax=Pseudomonas TaxID=286 RepID=UPI001B44464A|nr:MULTISPECIES: hypothetical protein [Pseudomonas]MBP1145021.1 hypothetical protein [Pseudomonas sp. PvP027]
MLLMSPLPMSPDTYAPSGKAHTHCGQALPVYFQRLQIFQGDIGACLVQQLCVEQQATYQAKSIENSKCSKQHPTNPCQSGTSDSQHVSANMITGQLPGILPAVRKGCQSYQVLPVILAMQHLKRSQ